MLTFQRLFKSRSTKMMMILLICWLVMNACALGGQTPTPTPPDVAEPTHAAATPVDPTATFTPAPTLTPTPTLRPTPILQPTTPITSANVALLAQQAQIGRGSIQAAVWSPDGKTLALGTGNGVYLFDADALDLKLHLDSGYSNRIAWNPTGDMLATGSDDAANLTGWDVNTGAVIFSKPFTHGMINAMTFNEAGTLLTAANQTSGEDNIMTYTVTTHLDSYNPQTGALIKSTPLVNQKMKSLGFIPTFCDQGRQLQTLVPGSDGSYTFTWWDALSGRQLFTHKLTFGGVFPLPTSGNLVLLQSFSKPTVLQVFDLETGEVITEQTLESKPLWLAVNPDGSLTVVLAGTLLKLDFATLAELERSALSPKLPRATYNADVTRGLLVEEDLITLVDPADNARLAGMDQFYDYPRNPLVSGDGKTLLTEHGSSLGGDVLFKLWDVDTLSLRQVLDLHQYSAASPLIAQKSDQAFFLARRDEPGIDILDVLTGEITGQINPSDASINSMAVSADGRLLQLDNIIYEIESGQQITEIPAYGFKSTYRSGLNADGTRALFKDENYLLVWDVAAREEIFHLQQELVMPLINAAGTQLAFATFVGGHSVQLYDVNSGDQIANLPMQHYVHQLVFSPDGSLLVASVNVEGLYFIETESGKIVHHIAYDPAGLVFANQALLVTASSDGTIRFWAVP